MVQELLERSKTSQIIQIPAVIDIEKMRKIVSVLSTTKSGKMTIILDDYRIANVKLETGII